MRIIEKILHFRRREIKYRGSTYLRVFRSAWKSMNFARGGQAHRIQNFSEKFNQVPEYMSRFKPRQKKKINGYVI